MSQPVSIKTVSKVYGDFIAVDNVDLEIESGEFLSLLGPSGAGKTTILQMIAGFTLADTGHIEIGGMDVTYLPPHRRPVNTVFQNYALFPHMTVAENVAYGLRQDGVPGEERRKRVKEALDMVEMLPMADRMPNALSGGQQQRVALARAIVKRPSVLLLDEPLGALDRRLRDQMHVELKSLQRNLGITFVFVTHDQEEALAMSDRIVVMRHGRIEQTGTPSELYDQPKTAFVAGFVGAQNFMVCNVVGSSSRKQLTANGVDIAVNMVADPHDDEVLAAVRPEHVMLSKSEPQQSANKAVGRVFEMVHLGDAMEFMVRLPSGLEFLSRQSRRSAPDVAPGDEVWVHWQNDDVAIFTRDTEVEAVMLRSENVSGSS